MKNIYRQTFHHDQPGKIFITRFLKQFADNFLYAWELNETNQSLQNTNWETYFSNPGAANWQLVVAGVNAHINGDMGKTLIGLFSIDELKKHRKVFIDARESLRPVMRKYLDTLKSQNKLFRFMYAASLGSPKLFANILLYKWRSRQYRLAMLYYRNPRRFTRLENRIAIKKQRIDRIIFNIQ